MIRIIKRVINVLIQVISLLNWQEGWLFLIVKNCVVPSGQIAHLFMEYDRRGQTILSQSLHIFSKYCVSFIFFFIVLTGGETGRMYKPRRQVRVKYLHFLITAIKKVSTKGGWGQNKQNSVYLVCARSRGLLDTIAVWKLVIVIWSNFCYYGH